MRTKKLWSTVSGMCLVAGLATGLAAQPINPIPEFQGEFTEDMSGLFTGFQTCAPSNILNGQAQLCVTGNMLNSGSWSFACNIQPQRGTHFVGASGGYLMLTFQQPMERFGGWFGSNASATTGATAEFYDQNQVMIGSARLDPLAGTCTWHWFGWESDVPIFEVHLKNDAHGGAFLMVDYLTADAFGGEQCYANCDGSTTEPILTVDDFTCFINEFAAAQSLPPAQQIEHYANCDGSTTEPILTVDDFTCFINAFAQGCP